MRAQLFDTIRQGDGARGPIDHAVGGKLDAVLTAQVGLNEARQRPAHLEAA